jgi:hypothetical protein
MVALAPVTAFLRSSLFNNFNSCYVIHIQRSPSNTPHMMATHCSQAFKTSGAMYSESMRDTVSIIICGPVAAGLSGGQQYLPSKLTPHGPNMLRKQSSNTTVSQKKFQYKFTASYICGVNFFFLLMGFFGGFVSALHLMPFRPQSASCLRPQAPDFKAKFH